MFEFHADRKRYFDIQAWNAAKYVIPFVEESFAIKEGMRVLDIGAGEGGVLKSFIDRGCSGVAVEFDEARVRNGQMWLEDEIRKGGISFVTKDMYQTTPEELGGKFDIIVLKDVIEHIHDQQKMIGWLHHFIKPGGVIFFGFPPWQMPYGGHQQMGVKRLSRTPWIHLFPADTYKGLLHIFKEHPQNIDMLMEVKETGLSIERFEKIVQSTGWRVLHRKHYLLNPIYTWKFGWRPIKQANFVRGIPYVRNFLTTCVYYLITPAEK